MKPNHFSPKTSEEKNSLHPNLQAALSHFNVDLNEELNRFRQEQKQRQGITIAESGSGSQQNSELNSLVASPMSLTSTTETTETNDWEEPDSYLASSEELLRHLNNEKDQDHHLAKKPSSHQNNRVSQTEATSSSWRDYLLTPLGIAGILIFFLSGTLVSMILVNFAQTHFSTASSSVEETDASASTDADSSTTESTESSDSSIPNRPNLANDEFIELDVDNLVEAEPANEATPSETPSCGSEFYCVMVENPNQMQYQRTRQIVPDAYLRDFPEVGQVLQLGAFKSEAQAKALQQRLDEQGITTKIYSP
jgi:hypothetical protein